MFSGDAGGFNTNVRGGGGSVSGHTGVCSGSVRICVHGCGNGGDAGWNISGGGKLSCMYYPHSSPSLYADPFVQRDGITRRGEG